MANILIEENDLINIATAIRNKNGLTTTYLPASMPSAISAINLTGSIITDMIATRTISGNISGISKSVMETAFEYCSMLTSVNFPECTSIGYAAFRSCYSLTSISFPECTFIGSYAFSGCLALTSISFPKCTSINNYAFQNCYLLISLYLNNVSSVPTLGTAVFNSTPIGGYSASAGQYGSVFVPASLYDAFIAATNWATISERIVSV